MEGTLRAEPVRNPSGQTLRGTSGQTLCGTSGQTLCGTLRAEREVRDATHLASDPAVGGYRRSGHGWLVRRLQAS